MNGWGFVKVADILTRAIDFQTRINFQFYLGRNNFLELAAWAPSDLFETWSFVFVVLSISGPFRLDAVIP